MERYDYMEDMKEDIKNYINDKIKLSDFADREEIEEHLKDILFVSDDVTGNASGSYYCNAWKAEESICHNLDLLAKAVEEFGGNTDVLKDGAEACDVIIRCYLLNQAIREVLEDMEDELEKAFNDELVEA